MASHAHSSAGGRRHPQTDTVLAVCVAGSLRAHERWDGKGYPDGLRGEAIPIEGRNVTVEDVYNALVVNRVYRHGFERAKAHQILNSGVGSQWDERVVAASCAVEANQHITDLR